MKKGIDKIKPYIYILPAFIFLCLFTYYPFLKSIYLSLFRYNLSTPQKKFIGLENYIHLFKDPVFWIVVKNNIFYAIGTIIASVGTALIFAIMIHENIRKKTYFMTSIFYPNVIPMAAAAMIWVWLFSPGYGLIDYLLSKIGFDDIEWLSDHRYALVAIIIVGVWKSIGYYMILFLAGLQNIPDELYEAGKIDGAVGLKKVIYITFPMLSPTILFVIIIAIMNSFQAIDQVYLMTRGGPGNATNLIVFFIYENAFRFYDIGYASTITSLLLIVLLILTILTFRVSKRRVYYA